MTPSEGSAPFEAWLISESSEDYERKAFCHGLTPALVAEGPRAPADGVFPPMMWDHMRYHVGPDAWLEEVLGEGVSDTDTPLS